jgi:hypothetical protein
MEPILPKMKTFISLFNIFPQVTKIPYQRMCLEDVYNESIFYTLKCRDDKTVHLQTYLDDIQEMFYMFYEGKKMISSGYGKAKDIVREVSALI